MVVGVDIPRMASYGGKVRTYFLNEKNIDRILKILILLRVVIDGHFSSLLSIFFYFYKNFFLYFIALNLPTTLLQLINHKTDVRLPQLPLLSSSARPVLHLTLFRPFKQIA